MENENFTGTTVDEPYELTAKITTNVNDVLTADDVINGGVPKDVLNGGVDGGPKLSNGHSFADNLVAAADSSRLDTSSDDGGEVKQPFSHNSSPGRTTPSISPERESPVGREDEELNAAAHQFLNRQIHNTMDGWAERKEGDSGFISPEGTKLPAAHRDHADNLANHFQGRLELLDTSLDSEDNQQDLEDTTEDKVEDTEAAAVNKVLDQDTSDDEKEDVGVTDTFAKEVIEEITAAKNTSEDIESSVEDYKALEDKIVVDDKDSENEKGALETLENKESLEDKQAAEPTKDFEDRESEAEEDKLLHEDKTLDRLPVEDSDSSEDEEEDELREVRENSKEKEREQEDEKERDETRKLSDMDTNELRNELTPSPIQAPARHTEIQNQADSSRESTPDLMNASQDEPVIVVDGPLVNQVVVDPMTQSMVMSQGFGEAPAASLVDCLEPDQQRQDMISPMSDRSVEAVEGKLELKLEADGYDYKVEDDDDVYVAPAPVAPQSNEYAYGVSDKTCPEEVKSSTAVNADASDSSDAESVCSETEAAQEVTGTLSFSVAAEAPLTTTVTQASSDMNSLGKDIPQANDNLDNDKDDSSDDDDNDQADHVPNIVNVDDEDDLNEKLKHMSMTSSVMVESTTKPFAAADNDDNDDTKSSDSSSDSDSDEDIIKPSHDNVAKANDDDDDDKSSSSSSDSEDEAEKPFQEKCFPTKEMVDSDSDSDNEEAVDDIKDVADSRQEPHDVLANHHDNETVEDRHDVHGALAELEDTMVHETVNQAGEPDFMPGMQQTELPASQQEEPTTADGPINILDSASTEEGPVGIPDSDGINGLCTTEAAGPGEVEVDLASASTDDIINLVRENLTDDDNKAEDLVQEDRCSSSASSAHSEASSVEGLQAQDLTNVAAAQHQTNEREQNEVDLLVSTADHVEPVMVVEGAENSLLSPLPLDCTAIVNSLDSAPTQTILDSAPAQDTPDCAVAVTNQSMEDDLLVSSAGFETKESSWVQSEESAESAPASQPEPSLSLDAMHEDAVVEQAKDAAAPVVSDAYKDAFPAEFVASDDNVQSAESSDDEDDVVEVEQPTLESAFDNFNKEAITELAADVKIMPTPLSEANNPVDEVTKALVDMETNEAVATSDPIYSESAQFGGEETGTGLDERSISPAQPSNQLPSNPDTPAAQEEEKIEETKEINETVMEEEKVEDALSLEPYQELLDTGANAGENKDDFEPKETLIEEPIMMEESVIAENTAAVNEVIPEVDVNASTEDNASMNLTKQTGEESSLNAQQNIPEDAAVIEEPMVEQAHEVLCVAPEPIQEVISAESLEKTPEFKDGAIEKLENESVNTEQEAAPEIVQEAPVADVEVLVPDVEAPVVEPSAEPVNADMPPQELYSNSNFVLNDEEPASLLSVIEVKSDNVEPNNSFDILSDKIITEDITASKEPEQGQSEPEVGAEEVAVGAAAVAATAISATAITAMVKEALEEKNPEPEPKKEVKKADSSKATPKSKLTPRATPGAKLIDPKKKPTSTATARPTPSRAPVARTPAKPSPAAKAPTPTARRTVAPSSSKPAVPAVSKTATRPVPAKPATAATTRKPISARTTTTTAAATRTTPRTTTATASRTPTSTTRTTPATTRPTPARTTPSTPKPVAAKTPTPARTRPTPTASRTPITNKPEAKPTTARATPSKPATPRVPLSARPLTRPSTTPRATSATRTSSATAPKPAAPRSAPTKPRVPLSSRPTKASTTASPRTPLSARPATASKAPSARPGSATARTTTRAPAPKPGKKLASSGSATPKAIKKPAAAAAEKSDDIKPAEIITEAPAATADAESLQINGDALMNGEALMNGDTPLTNGDHSLMNGEANGFHEDMNGYHEDPLIPAGGHDAL